MIAGLIVGCFLFGQAAGLRQEHHDPGVRRGRGGLSV